MPRRKSRSKSRRKSRSRSRSRRRSATRFVSHYPVAPGVCRGRTKSLCMDDNACTYRKRVGCVAKKGARRFMVESADIGLSY